MIVAMKLKNHLEKTGTTIAQFARDLSGKCGKKVSRDVVYQWIHDLRPIPVPYCHPIEGLTGGDVTRKDSRPDDWKTIWPELASSATTPPATVTSDKLAGEAA